jgi:hypothetical protein
MSRRCSVSGCNKRTGNRRYYCEAHYFRIRRNGNTGKTRIKKIYSHLKSKTAEYRAWAAMIGRCYNSNNPRFPYYGGRGVKVCSRWRTFENFLRDMGEKPGQSFSLDRINTNGNYSPSNCQWATHSQQMINRRTSRVIRFRRQSKTVVEWARETGLKRETITARLNRGWSVRRALNF